MYKKLLYGIAAALALFNNSVQAQVQDSSYRFPCRLSVDFIEAMTIDSPGHGASFALTLPASFPAAAIDTCGKFQVFYADLELAPATGIYKGFADATLGATRRNTMCAALHYIQSRIDFGTLADTEYIRLYVDTSCSSAFPAGAHYLSSGATMHSFLALSSPYHAPMAAGDTVNGFIHDFITTGIDPNIGDYHGYIKMNFDSAYLPGLPQPIIYNNDLSDPFCTEFDLCYVLIHYITHTLGWFSWTDSLHSGMGSLSNFTNYDLSLHKTPRRRFAVNPFSGLTKVFPSSPTFAADYWVNDHLPPDNYPVNPGTPSHLSESYYDLRVSPGEYQQYLMGATFGRGQKKREFMKGEWETLHNTIGYTYNTDFYSDSNSIIVNHLPHSVKMGSDTMNRLFYFYFVQAMPEYIPADYHIRNDIGTSVTINLNSLTDLQDADGDSISVYPGSLVNFRGCGVGGNNHNLLTLSNGGKTISYAPRANFYGRAQFGFNLWDGIEKGGFVVFTIDVSKGNNVSVVSGDNMMLNGDFEEGSEIRTDDTNLHIPNGVFARDELSQHMSDSHPHDYSNAHFGTAIRNAHKVCTLSPDKIYYFGHDWCTFPDTFDFFGSYYIPPNPFMGLGNRYQPIAIRAATFYLADTLLPCQRYVLEFDALRTLTSSSSVYPYPKYDSIIIGFGRDTFFNYTTRTFYSTTTKPYPTDSIKFGVWNHLSIPFTYCKDSSANIISLFIKGLNGFAPPQIIDNVSLKAISEPLSFSLTDSSIGNCSRRVFSDLFDLGCSSFTYEWRKLGDTTIIATSSTIDISNTVESVYTLRISDGCSFNLDTITIAPCPCMPGAVFGATSYDTLTTGSIPTTVGSGIYYIPSDIAITSTSSFSNGLFLIEPNVKITVAAANKLTIDNCHLLTCPDTNKLWKGIELQSVGTTSAQISIINNSLIEDAEIAINAVNPQTPGTGNIIEVKDAVFNRNLLGIYINNYTATTIATYPFSIVNTVFTSRQLNKAGSGYPTVWSDAKSLKAYTDNGTYAPYTLAKTYSPLWAKNGKYIEAGVKLYKVGNFAAGTYYGIEIGGGLDSTDANLFDNTSTGIHAEQCNLSSYNNIFINMQYIDGPAVPPPGISIKYRGCGIYANTLGVSPNRIRIMKDPLVNGLGVNKFFDCSIGIQSFGYYETDIQSNRISSSNTDSSGYAGIAIYSTTASPCKHYRADFNSISNVSYGIQLFASSTLDSVTVKNNEFFAVNPWLPTGISGAGQFIHHAILFDGASAGGTSPVMIRSNTIEEAYNGIDAANVRGHRLRIEFNDISKMRALASAKAQYAISVKNNYRTLVSNNNISMNSLATTNKIRGIYASFNTNLQVCNNSTVNIDRAFDFAQVRPQVGTRWVLNAMDNSNKGFVLGSDIGHQGYTFIDYLIPPFHYLAAGNKWTGFGGAKDETFVEKGLNSDKSILHVRRGVMPKEEPTINSSAIPSPSYPQFYDTLGSLIIKQDLTNCDGLLLPTRYFPVSSGTKTYKALGMMVVSDSLGYDDKLSQWMAQLSVYESGLQDSVQIDSFPIFDRFMQHAATSRYEWIADVQSALNNKDTNLATSLLATIPQAAGRQVIDTDVIITDYNEADTLIENYSIYYDAYLKFLKKQTLDTIGLEALAAKCPAKDGAAVYLARSLYSLISGVNTSYDDDSCMDNGGGQYRIVKDPSITGGSRENQNYTLYPNPNNGTFLIKQSIADNKAVNLKVYNAIGAMVYSSDANFVNGQMSVKLGQKAHGVYLVCIGDMKERTICLRFIIN